MRLLFISSLLPTESPASGFEIANKAIIDEYRRQGVDLVFAGFSRPGGGEPGKGQILLGEIPIENAAVGHARKLTWILKAVRDGLPVAAAKLAVLSRDVLIRRLEEAGPVDAYVLNSIQMPTAYPFLYGTKPSIFIAHNVEHRSARENAASARTTATNLLYRREAALLERAETRVCRAAAVVHTLSRDDGIALGLGGDPRCHPLPLSIGRPTLPDDGRRTHDIGLIGTWSWAPNRAGLDWFVEDVVPLLPATLRISIAGRFDGAPPPAPANVTFTGPVPDAQAFVRGSRVIALATKGGTGVQLKTIETFEEGLPAVATPAALRGVDRIPDNVRVADEAAGFAAALVDLVAGERRGSVSRRNGFAFMLGQRHALSDAIRSGLKSLEGVIGEGARGIDGPARVRDAGDAALEAARG